MRLSVSALFLLAATIPAVRPAAAQPGETPLLSDVAEDPPPAAAPAAATVEATVTYAPTYAPTYAAPSYYPTYYYAPAPVIVAAPARPRRPHGVYFTESFSALSFSDEIANHVDGAVRFRAALGYRRNQLAFELWAGGGFTWRHHDAYASASGALSVGEPSPTTDGGYRDDYYSAPSGIGMLGFDVKYLKTLSKNFEVYAKGGLSRAYADDLGSGPGVGIGGGAHIKGKIPVLGFLFWPLFFTGIGPKCTAALYMETGYEFYRLHNDRSSTDAQLTHWTLGFSIGSDI